MKEYNLSAGIFSLLGIAICTSLLFSLSGCWEWDKKENKITMYPPDTINYFVENSGSMLGYVKSDDFGEVVNDAFTKLGNVDTLSIKSYLIASEGITPNTLKINQIQGSNQFRNTITEAKKSDFNEKASHFAKNIDTILKKYVNDSTTSIFISDCIYSKGKGVTRKRDYTTELKPRLEEIINRQKKEGLAGILFQLKTEYDDIYYIESREANPKTLPDPNRPYYILVLGKQPTLRFLISPQEFDMQEKFEKFDYKNIASFNLYNNESINDTLFWKCGANNCTPRPGQDAVDIQSQEGDTVKFLVGLNLQHFPDKLIDKTFLQENLVISNKGSFQNLHYKVYENNPPFDCPEEREEINNNTHFIQISFTSLSKGDHTLNFSLPNAVPSWVENSHTMTDYPVAKTKGKTYGFKYVVQGMHEGFGGENTNYFQFDITVKN